MLVTSKITKYLYIAIMSWKARLATLSELVGEIPIIGLQLWILYQLYMSTYSTQGASQLESMTVAQVIWILMIVTCFNTASYPTVSSLIDEEVRSGTLTYSLSRPYSYILFHYTNFLGRTLPAILLFLCVGIIITLILAGPIPIRYGGLLFGIILMFTGYTLDFFIELSIGLLAFWIEDTVAISFIYRNAIQILGGSIIPLSLYPQPLKWLATALPFSQLFYAPAELLVMFNKKLLLSTIVTQGSWLFVAIFFSYALFYRGVKNVSISGG